MPPAAAQLETSDSTQLDIARRIGQPSAARAVARATAGNLIGYLIPCHRVIRKSGAISDYRWGRGRRLAIIGWEAARLDRVA